MTSILQNFTTDMEMELFLDFFLRLALNMTTIYVLVYGIFYPKNAQPNFFFSMPQMGLVIFLVSAMLSQFDLEIALTLGILAMFSILRYRTVPVEIKEMSYLITVIGMSIINAIVEFQFNNWLGLLVVNFLILLVAYFGENRALRLTRGKKLLTFELPNMTMLKDKDALIDEINRNTELGVYRVDIQKINMTKNEVTLWIFYEN